MVMEGIALGWILIIAGAVMLLIEVSEPGYFIGVPATVMIILGILLVLGIDILDTVWGVVIGVAVAIGAAAFTVFLYGRLTPEGEPTTISGSALIGREGRVIRTTDPDSIEGKVIIGGIQWSARSEAGEIPVGRKVIVVRSEGVHVVVREVAE
ncbi:putative activity regulator of membrane protease ybbk [hydrocarbon metagenome]|uniref:Putative activity regulator of membrane protease ybbk n=1 Tax=hydrocarbon metagenome TaxID=938273 RepID=A0A0W8FH91_9ZZZZ|nr:NfeD family protein [Methanomicrobiaceae archaeon]